MEIDTGRLRSDLEESASIGAIEADEGRGRTVLTGSEANRDARDRLIERLEGAGLDVSVDAVGNLTGTWTPPSANPGEAPVAAGSHLDSVPEGGIFDGQLGVYAALEAIRSLQESGFEPARPLTVVSFTEEEGATFAGGLLGSSVATGQRSVENALALTDGGALDRDGRETQNGERDGGRTLERALEDIGYRGEGRLDASEWDAFLELHVEQDTVLESHDVSVGVVTAITGISHSSVQIRGEANHAGATAMTDRTDALAAASEFVLALEAAGNHAAEAGDNTAVATVGNCTVSPNATNVIPGTVDLGVDIRDVDGDVMRELLTEAETVLEALEGKRGVETTMERHLEVDPAAMSERCQQALESEATALGVDSLSLHSGAAHDAMNVARVTDTGMLFAPSRGGYSHSPLEWTDWEDCATATRVLAAAMARLSSER
ncbi:Zn-dependent hydrolase [Natrialbaceae archaeon A-CW1-1]